MCKQKKRFISRLACRLEAGVFSHDKDKKNRIRIQNIGWVKVRGIDQLKGYELANAKLVNKLTGYYLMITCYEEKKEDSYTPGSIVGVDMGVATHITRSDGVKVDVLVKESKILKRLQRKLSRQVKGSRGYENTRCLIQREYEKLNNKKNDAANKIAHDLLLNEFVFIQDENLRGWKVRFGRSIHHSILGRVKERLVRSDRCFVVDRFVSTTKKCVCGVVNPVTLGDRVYSCSSCVRVMDRDVHSAQRMVQEGLSLVPVERRDVKLVENESDLVNLLTKHCSVKPEAYTSLACR